MISINGLKRKSLSAVPADSNNSISTTPKRFRGIAHEGKINHNEHQIALTTKTMTISNGKQDHDTMEMISSREYRQLQHELQCQEALLILMQKLKANQRSISQTKPTTATPPPPVNTTNGKTSITPTKQQPLNSTNRSTPPKPPHPNQYTVNRSNNNPQSSKMTVPLPQATRQSNNSTQPTTATRISSTVPITATKNPSLISATNNSSKSNGTASEQHLLNAKLALRKQLEQTLLQIPTPKPTTCDLTYIPGINGWSEFLTVIGLEQAFNTYADRRLLSEISINIPYICAQCGTDWSVTWHEISTSSETDEKIVCDRCRKTSQKKILKQDHSNRLRQAFMKALQQEKELDAKFQQQTPITVKPQPTPTASSSSSSSSHNKPLTTKISSNHRSSKTTTNHHHHRHSGKISSSKTPSSTETLASTLAALQTNEQMEYFQKHFLSNMFPFALANQAAFGAKSTQQQQQALAASLPAMAASLMRQQNPAQYLLDMIPQAAKQQQQQQQHQQQHHRHSK